MYNLYKYMKMYKECTEEPRYTQEIQKLKTEDPMKSDIMEETKKIDIDTSNLDSQITTELTNLKSLIDQF